MPAIARVPGRELEIILTSAIANRCDAATQAALGTYLVPTLSALKNILAAGDHGIPDYMLEKAARVSESHQRSIKMFYQAGGRIAMGTDAGTPFNRHGENAQELRHMVDVEISPMDAIWRNSCRR